MQERIIMAKHAKVLLPDLKKREYNKEITPLIYAMMRNVESLGFSLDYRILDNLRKCTKEEITEIYNDIMPVLKHMVGDDVVYKPMYPGFPEQVWETPEIELYFNAFLHYLSGGEWVPEYPEEELKKCKDDKENFPDLNSYLNLKTLNQAYISDYHDLMNATMLMRSRFTNENEEEMAFYVKKYSDRLSPDIPFKENAIFVANELINNKASVDKIATYLKTPTDVLRYVLAQSGKSVTLTDYVAKKGAKNFKNSVISKNEELFMKLFEKNPSADDFCAHKNMFKILTKLMHYNVAKKNYKHKYPKAFSVIDRCQKDKLQSFNARLDELLRTDQFKKYIDLYATRPGYMLQNLDAIISNTKNEDINYVFTTLSNPDFIKKASPLLWAKTMTHFIDRKTEMAYRHFAYNKSTTVNNEKVVYTKHHIIKDERTPIDEVFANTIINKAQDAIKLVLSEKNTVGKIYVDPALKKSRYLVPMGNKKNSDARDLAPGTIINMDNKMSEDKAKQYITMFCYWKDKNNRVDVDLNANFVFKDGHIETIDYTNLKNNYACHSGDYISGYDGACEFICIDRTRLPKDVELIVTGLNSYSGQPYITMESCHVGIVLDNTSFNPQNVLFKTDLEGFTTQNTPCLFDVKNNNFCYLNLEGRLSRGGTGKSFLSNMYPQIQSVLSSSKFELLDLIDLNVQARGEYTDNILEADVIFTEDLNILIDSINNELSEEEKIKAPEDALIVTPYDKEMILSYFLPEKDPVIVKEKVLEAELETEIVEDEVKELTLDEKIQSMTDSFSSIKIGVVPDKCR